MNAAKPNRVVGRIRSKMNRKNKDATKSPILEVELTICWV
jgi:hypothetical protein